MPLYGGAHAARRVRSVQAYEGVAGLQVQHDLTEPCAQHVADRRPAPDGRPLRKLRSRRAEHSTHLGRTLRGQQAGRPDSGIKGREDLPVTIDELDLELAPRHARPLVAVALAGHGVVGELGQDTTVPGQQLVHGPPGDQRGHGLEPLGAHPSADEGRERGRAVSSIDRAGGAPRAARRQRAAA